MKTFQVHVTGIVQGVGFRPFVYGLALRYALAGWVCNTSSGVDIEIQGQEVSIQNFLAALQSEKPPLARLDSILATEIHGSENFSQFTIRRSTSIANAFQPIPADVAICEDCRRELFDPQDRRYLYPFINCTNCGPRFTIIKDIPYDRPATTMAGFLLCPQCRTEYEDPLDRRFHAQPVACPNCGPHVWLPASEGKHLEQLDALLRARRLLREGQILAVKGLGGFHLACDASNPESVEILRQRKGRAGKPFALMAADLATIEKHCCILEAERNLLVGRDKPIVLLKRQPGCFIPESLAPGLDTIGMMLPYTPLHLLLINQVDPVLEQEPAPSLLVMTSGNFSEEPISTDNKQAGEHLAPLADAFLFHNRAIHIRCDDSVIQVVEEPSTVDGKEKVSSDHGARLVFLRRSRGYAPYPVNLTFQTRQTLAVGGDLKNTFCISRDRYAFLSHHIGDMENAETYASFDQGIDHLSRLFRVNPEIVACDMHPAYFTTRWAQQAPYGTPPLLIQHHHAHIASCMADNELENHKVIGLAFDGTGYGTDGTIWGGEVLVADYQGFARLAHLEYLPLPGGDSAIRHPLKIAIGYAHALGLDISDLPVMRRLDPFAVNVIRLQTGKQLNTVLNSSMGRLFDAVAALAGVRTDVTYEAQAAIELEVLSGRYLAEAQPYPFQVQEEIIQLKDLLTAVIESIRQEEPPGRIGARFHRTIAQVALRSAAQVRERTGLNEVVLSGGVWQNRLLLELTIAALEGNGFCVYTHHQTPTNDGGIALGQVAVANHMVV